MSITCASLYNEVLSFIGAPDDADATAIAILGLNDAIRRLDSRDWWWTLMVTDVTLTADLVTYALSSDFKAPRHMELLDGNNLINGQIPYMDPKSFDRELSGWGTYGAAAGDPCLYTVFNSHESDQDDIRFDVAPSAGFVSNHPKARLRYFRRTARLSTGGDVLDCPSEVESFVAWHAKMFVASNYQPDKVRLAIEQADRVWRMMLQDEMRIQSRDWV